MWLNIYNVRQYYFADINGILNIIRKSNAMSLEALYIRGGVDTPVRIRIAWAVMWET